MATTESLTQFVHDALGAGRSRDEIRNALTDAGWSTPEITASLASFATTDFTPPVPRPRQQLTARDTFIYLLLFSSLGLVAFNLVDVLTGILDLALPDPAASNWEERYTTDKIRWSIAALVVSTPVYVWMALWVHRRISHDVGHRRSPARRWLTYMALFVAALVFLGDITYVIYNFLTGEITLRLMLKAGVIACVSTGIFVFYLLDIREQVDEH